MNITIKKAILLFAAVFLASTGIDGIVKAESQIEKEQIPITVSYDITQWDQYWKPGEKKLEATEETRSKVDAILLRIDQASEGTPVREGSDNDTVEFQYA